MSGGCEEEAKKAPGGGRFPFWSRISNCKQIRTLTESLDLFPHRKKNCLYVQYVTAILQLLSSQSRGAQIESGSFSGSRRPDFGTPVRNDLSASLACRH